MKLLRLPLLGLGLAALCLSAFAAKPNANAVSYATRANPEILVLDARNAAAA